MPIGSPPSAPGGLHFVGRLDDPMGSRTETIETQ
jgi:hypothetical protein